MDHPLPHHGASSSAKLRVNLKEYQGFRLHVDEILTKVDQLDQRVDDVEKFYREASQKKANKEKQRPIASIRKQLQEASRREAAASKRMQDLIRQLDSKLLKITEHNWVHPFMKPVDVKGLGLDDYYEIIDKPMDFSTIKNKIEGAGYKNVREICADVRLIFKNAIKYNSEKSNVHVMAKTLLAKFEEIWLQFLPKVTEEEMRRDVERAEAQLDMQLAQEASYNKLAGDISNELYEVGKNLDELREMVVLRCRKISTEDKRSIGHDLALLSPEDLSKALEIVAQNNPSFQSAAAEVDLDMDAQSEETLWRLKFFVKDILEGQGKKVTNGGGNTNTTGPNNNKHRQSKGALNNNNKRKKEISDNIVKTARKRTKKSG